MKKLRQIVELFNSTLPARKLNGISNKRHHFYAFSDDKKKDYIVHIDHQSGNGVAEIGFSTPDERGQKPSFIATGTSGRSASRIFSTVGNIMKNHAAEHQITHYTFGASDKEPQRQALYNTIAKRFGGASGEGSRGMREYIVPTGVKRDND